MDSTTQQPQKPKLRTPEEIAAIRARAEEMLFGNTVTTSAKSLIPGDLATIPPGAQLVYTNAKGETETVDLNPSAHGLYMVTFPGEITFGQVAPSSTNKSLIATVRVDLGRSKMPIAVTHPTKGPRLMEFGGFNINLNLGHPREVSVTPEPAA